MAITIKTLKPESLFEQAKSRSDAAKAVNKAPAKKLPSLSGGDKRRSTYESDSKEFKSRKNTVGAEVVRDLKGIASYAMGDGGKSSAKNARVRAAGYSDRRMDSDPSYAKAYDNYEATSKKTKKKGK